MNEWTNKRMNESYLSDFEYKRGFLQFYILTNEPRRNILFSNLNTEHGNKPRAWIAIIASNPELWADTAQRKPLYLEPAPLHAVNSELWGPITERDVA